VQFTLLCAKEMCNGKITPEKFMENLKNKSLADVLWHQQDL